MVRPWASWMALSVFAVGFGCESREARSSPAAPVRPSAAPAASAPARPHEPGPVSGAGPAAPSLVEEHQVAGHRLQLVSEGQTCVLVARMAGAPAGVAAKKLALPLEPPCHFLVWRHGPPRRAGAPSDGISVGDVGAPMAWRYGSAKNVTAIAVIGDALSEQQRKTPIVAKRLAAGLRCAASIQGILLEATGVRLGPKQDRTGVHCVEAGVDEKTFWMLAHD